MMKIFIIEKGFVPKPQSPFDALNRVGLDKGGVPNVDQDLYRAQICGTDQPQCYTIVVELCKSNLI